MNRITLFAAPLLLAPLMAGCVSFKTVHDGISRARIDETVAVGPLRVMPTKLLEDSRCPAGVQCISAGQVRITAAIDAAPPVELTLGQPVAVAGGALALVEVYPPRRKDWTLYPDEYRFGFTFTPRP